VCVLGHSVFLELSSIPTAIPFRRKDFWFQDPNRHIDCSSSCPLRLRRRRDSSTSTRARAAAALGVRRDVRRQGTTRLGYQRRTGLALGVRRDVRRRGTTWVTSGELAFGNLTLDDRRQGTIVVRSTSGVLVQGPWSLYLRRDVRRQGTTLTSGVLVVGGVLAADAWLCPLTGAAQSKAESSTAADAVKAQRLEGLGGPALGVLLGGECPQVSQAVAGARSATHSSGWQVAGPVLLSFAAGGPWNGSLDGARQTLKVQSGFADGGGTRSRRCSS
jgi:hypothetical protein